MFRSLRSMTLSSILSQVVSSKWLVIAILAMVASAGVGIVALQMGKMEREQAAQLRAQQLARERADKAAEINRKEQETIRKAPDFRLLRD
jgi:hypothetical protein